MRTLRRAVFGLVLAVAAGGCVGGYTWTSEVPAEMRTVAVPVFRNESAVTELGAVVAGQVLREFQREGTFRLSRDPAVEVQGVIKSVDSSATSYSRRSGLRHAGYTCRMEAVVSVIDRRAGRVLVDNRAYAAVAAFTGDDDLLTAQRDASGRLAEDLARQVVDDVVNLNWRARGHE